MPCGSIDQVEDFYRCLGFTRTYRQVRPNPYVALERDDIALGFFGMPGFDPADSYGSCVVIVPDIAALHAAFATGLRERYGKDSGIGHSPDDEAAAPEECRRADRFRAGGPGR